MNPSIAIQRVFSLVFILVVATSALRCYTGFKFTGGQSQGDETMDCESTSDSCYNLTAEAGILLTANKAGCSTYRCYLSQDTCRSTDLGGIPVRFCCCSTDMCNGRD